MTSTVLICFSVDADFQVSYRHHYDARQKKWTRSLINVIVKAEPFAEGAMRTAHHMQDLSVSASFLLFVPHFLSVSASFRTAHHMQDLSVSASFLALMRRTTSPFSC